MLEYNVRLKGLKFGEEVYEVIDIVVRAETEEEIDSQITDHLYTVRLDNLYYKMKYVHKELSHATQRTAGIQSPDSFMEEPPRS